MERRKSSAKDRKVEWMWQSNRDPFSKSEEAEWSYYIDVESVIIEKAFSKKQLHAVLDNYYIDFKMELQISKQDSYRQRPVKRVTQRQEDRRVREKRFDLDPCAPKCSFNNEYGWISPFILETIKYLKLEPKHMPSKDQSIVPMIVKRAAEGIVEEGVKIEKQVQAEFIANILMKKKNKKIKEVWTCCAYLYSMESFLYKILNETMRSIGSEDHEKIWRSKIPTLGPFCLLLWDDPVNTELKTNMKLYRMANLTNEQITTYIEMVKYPNEYRSFQAFTSCSRNPLISKDFKNMNVLFIMDVLLAFSADLKPISSYPEEEEELIIPGVCFNVLNVEFDNTTNIYHIHLKLRQRFTSKHESFFEVVFLLFEKYPYDSMR